jgi:tRNA (5-methylaminomethyl-2-thiouridylate)-methyltransferase
LFSFKINKMKKNVAVLISGGVDSSVALSKLKNDGHSVCAYYIKIWLEDELSYLGNCPWREDLEFVKKTCSQLEVPLEIIPMQSDYHDKVVRYAISQIKLGNTPNPDIFCNRMIKFGCLFDAIQCSHDLIATGHYAKKIENDNDSFNIALSKDKFKDQTYFLSYTPYSNLEKVIFPLEDMTKAEVREYAEKMNLPSSLRPDSQGICFLGKIKFKEFVLHHLGKKAGRLVEYETGNILDNHDGYWFYTIGQRQGIGLSGGPWYVVKKDIPENVVYVSKSYYAENKRRDFVSIRDINWLVGDSNRPKVNDDLYLKIRHGEFMHDATVSCDSDDEYSFTLSTYDQGIAPGQFVAMYDKNEICLGAGVIF